MNFALLLFVLTAVTGAVWLLDRLVLEGRRRERARVAVADFDRRVREAGSSTAHPQRGDTEREALREPGWVEYSKAFFPVLLIVGSSLILIWWERRLVIISRRRLTA